MLIDNYNRVHDYLRISLTDQCNLRCKYCMPEKKYNFAPHENLMQTNEIISIVKTFVELGVKKIRLTGGEPLVRKDAAQIIEELTKFNVELAITTNATKTHLCLEQIKKANFSSINVSLDTLKKEKFYELTNRNQFDLVYNNLMELINIGMNVKINVVVMKNVNEDEIIPFIELTKEMDVQARFIEFMPFTGNKWSRDKLVTMKEILENISTKYKYHSLKGKPNDTSKLFKINDFKGTFAIISTMSVPFCSTCNRIRLTADGKIKNCLFSKKEVDLLTPFRNGEDIKEIILNNIKDKKKELGGQFTSDVEEVHPEDIKNRSMITIGG